MDSLTEDRVRRNTPNAWNQRIDRRAETSIRETPLEQIDDRVRQLEQEWSTERWIETEAASMALTGLSLTVMANRRWIAMPILVASAVWLHGVQGFYPLLPLFRWLGVRTRAEIDAEKLGLLERDGDASVEREVRRANHYDRVRRHTSSQVNARIDRELEARVGQTVAGGRRAILARLQELDREWDIERVLQVNASTLALTGLLLSLRSRRWLWLPAGVFSFFLQHGLSGWCPPIPVLRRLGVRTQREIDREKFQLRQQLSPGQ